MYYFLESFIYRICADFPNSASTGLSKAALGIILAGSIAGAIALSVVATTLIARRRSRHSTVSKRSCKQFIYIWLYQ